MDTLVAILKNRVSISSIDSIMSTSCFRSQPSKPFGSRAQLYFFTRMKLHTRLCGIRRCSLFKGLVTILWPFFATLFLSLKVEGSLLYDVGFLERARWKLAAALTDSIQQLTLSCLSIREHAAPALWVFLWGRWLCLTHLLSPMSEQPTDRSAHSDPFIWLWKDL